MHDVQQEWAITIYLFLFKDNITPKYQSRNSKSGNSKSGKIFLLHSWYWLINIEKLNFKFGYLTVFIFQFITKNRGQMLDLIHLVWYKVTAINVNVWELHGDSMLFYADTIVGLFLIIIWIVRKYDRPFTCPQQSAISAVGGAAVALSCGWITTSMTISWKISTVG